ncbi:LAQU0S03e08790g1_1 [Lachancea quebecensis]|uniref:LAQU0S03e08790g1_1 n=1 Tax=Lachancea quebecensis TaxID=1654605 RepID=A0A0P1KPF3_9SACH|nr:LAQU0S03e08790g1_1 [Lachancea quebecensis]
MFELPLVRNTKRVRTVRKLRYQYINTLYQEYRRVQSSATANSTLPTPENSAAEEASDGDHDSADATSRRRRRKRRLLSVLGHAETDTDLSDAEAEEGNDDAEQADSEKEFFTRHEKPQETFEVWNTDRQKTVPMNTSTLSYDTCKQIERRAQKRLSAGMGHISKNADQHFRAMRDGYEIVAETPESHHLAHITQLNELLHVNIMKGRWDIAYRCFSILIRLPGVDIRSMWGPGARILRELSSTDKGLGTSEEFLGWLSGIYSSRSNFNQAMNFLMDPVFRCGSKTHTAKFVVAWLWELLFASCPDGTEHFSEEDPSNRKLLRLIERLSEMVLIPPYMEDPEIWFIFAVCHLVSADQLSQRFISTKSRTSELERDISRNQVTQHITNAHNCIRTCETKKGDFSFPRRIIEEQLACFEKRLYQNNDDLTASDPESEFGLGNEQENLDTQNVLGPGMSSMIDEEDNFFGSAEQVHFGFDSDSST